MDLHKARGAFLKIMKTSIFIGDGEDGELFNRTVMIECIYLIAFIMTNR